MTDIRLARTADDIYDIGIVDDDIETDDSLETAVIISLFTNRRAPDAEVLPAGSNSRGGYWGDIKPAVAGDEIGSHLWLLARQSLSDATLERAKNYALDALKWMKDDGITKQISVVASRLSLTAMLLDIQITRPRGGDTSLQFEYAWIAQTYRRLTNVV